MMCSIGTTTTTEKSCTYKTTEISHSENVARATDDSVYTKYIHIFAFIYFFILPFFFFFAFLYFPLTRQTRLLNRIDSLL